MKTAGINGAAISFSDEGIGRPLLCLHGGMGIDAYALRVPGILDLAERNIRVIIPDQRGHGASSRGDASLYTREQWAADAHAMIDVLALHQTALLGYSYGGFIALEYALRWPETLTHLILVATSPGPVPSESGEIGTERDLKRFFRGVWPRLFVGEDKHWDLFASAQFSLDAYNAAFMRDLPSFNVRDRIPEIEIATLLLVGRHDPYLADMEWLASRMQNARLRIFENAGHFPFVEASADFTREVAAFLG